MLVTAVASVNMSTDHEPWSNSLDRIKQLAASDVFDADGSTRLIEVKTTGLGKYFPFNVTVNEVRCSQARPVEFHLYRVFNFGPDARLYMLAGELSKSCHLDPTQYRAFVQGLGHRGE